MENAQSLPGQHPLDLRVPPLLVAAFFGLIAWLIAQATGALALSGGTRGGLAGGLFLFGCIVAIAGVVSFRRAKTTVNPMKPDTSSALVTSGIYRGTRNPMYLGFLFFLLAEIAWLASPLALLAALLFVLYLNRFQIRPEEDALRARFAAEFDAYAARVRRWI